MAPKLLNQNLLKIIDLNQKVFIGFSGGPDSSALLHLVSKVDSKFLPNIKAIHINHNLSKNSAVWAEHCKDFCSKCNVDLIVESVHINSDGGGIESAARRARFEIFKNILEENNQILLGHHSDDAAETILMRLLRGPGVEGLNGIKMKRKLGSGILIRPFLDIPKKEILNYLKDHGINYIDDDSNKINDFDRNFLRNEIFPLLDSRWNNFAQRINSMSHIIQERNVNYTNLFLEKHGGLVGDKIDINKLKALQESLIIDVLRYSIKECNLAVPNSKIMKEIVKTFINSDPGPKSQVSWSRSDKEEPGGSVTYKKGFLLISKK